MEFLPREILFRIFDELEMLDLKSVSSVSKAFYDLTNDPYLWRKFTLTARCPKNLKNALSLYRLSKIEHLNIYYFYMSTMTIDIYEIFKELKKREFKSLTIVDTN